MTSIRRRRAKKSSSESSSATKEQLGLCQVQGCRRDKYETSNFCDFHKDEFFFLDMAHEVNVTGTSPPLFDVIKKANQQKKRIKEEWYVQAVEDEMRRMELSDDESSKTCKRACSKRGFLAYCGKKTEHSGTLCPVHLRQDMLKSFRKKVQMKEMFQLKWADEFPMPLSLQDVPNYPDEVIDRIRDVNRMIRQSVSSGCRYQDSKDSECSAYVKEFVHIGYCKKHIGKPQAILCILKRHKVLHSNILIRGLREIIVSMI